MGKTSQRMPLATGLRTPWAQQAIGAAHPLPEYPRPMLQRSEWVSLNGPWEYAVVPDMVYALENQPPPTTYEATITVPFALETVASGVVRSLAADEYLVYRRIFTVPREWEGRRVAINFEAIDQAAVVWVNGDLRGSHDGGYEPFTVDAHDVTGDLEIVVTVADSGPRSGRQYGKQSDAPAGIWYTATSGIWGSVWAEPLPHNAITYLTTRTHADLGGFDVIVETERPTDVTVEVSSEGERRPNSSSAWTSRHAQRLASAQGSSAAPIAIRLENPRLWSPADPYRYELTIRTGDDEVCSRAAIRTVEIGAIPGASDSQRHAVLLNGEPIFLNTPLDQGYWPETGLTPPSDEALIFDLEQVKALGFNGVRKHLKIESRRFYEHADRLGMLVVQDIPNGGKPRASLNQSAAIQLLDIHLDDTSQRAHRAAGRGDAANRDAFERDLAALVKLLDPHPSVVVWTLFNEAWGQYDAQRLAAQLRALDTSRPIDATSGWYDVGAGDFRSRHRYKLRLKPPPKTDPRPYFLSEFGGHNLAIEGHMWEAPGKSGYVFHTGSDKLNAGLTSLWRDQLIPLVLHGLRGCVYTQVSDVETESNGLFTYDRQVLKPDAELMRELNAELLAAFDALQNPKQS